MKEQILKLRNEGKTYNEIKNILGCSKSTISFHCNENSKINSAKRQRKRRNSNPFVIKLDLFRSLSERSRSFQRRSGSKLIPRVEYNFTVNDVIDRFIENPVCYLSGRKLDLSDGKNFSFDHKIPSSRGGNNEIENLGIVHSDLNRMKKNLTVDEFISVCKEVLIYNGYIVSNANDGKCG